MLKYEMQYHQAIKYISYIVIFVGLQHNIHAQMQSKIGGEFNFASGFHLDDNTEKNYITTYNTDQGFWTDAKIYADASYKIDDEKIVGGFIRLNTTTQSSSFSPYSHIYYLSNIGKFEIGSPLNVSSKIQMEALSLVKAGESWQYFINFPDSQYPSSLFMTLPYSDVDNTKRQELARKISYFTPKIGNTFQLGISYIPDTANIGSLSPSTAPAAVEYSYIINDTQTATISNVVKDAIAYSISFENEVSDDINLKLILSGAYGNPANKAIVTTEGSTDKDEITLSQLNSWNIGGILSYGPFSYSTSYSNLNQSLTSKEIHTSARDAFYWNTVISYNQGPVEATIQFHYSNYLDNIISLLSFSSDYQILPDLKSYVEISMYDAKYLAKESVQIQKGTMLVVGIKVSF